MLRRRRLARRLRQLRELSGMTLEEAAPRLDKTKSALGRVETGKTRADVHLVRSMMDLYDHYDPTLIDLAREAVREAWWTKYGIADRGFLGMETEAAVELEMSLIHIPGLLQTEAYMRALFAADLTAARGMQRGNDVAARLHRQRRLTDPDFPIELVAIIDEAALRTNVGGAEVMRAQLQHLVRQATLSTVTVQVLPSRHGAHLGMEGEFTLLTFPEGDDPDLLYVAYITGSLHIENPEEVAEARIAFDRLRSEALNPTESAAFIDQVRGELQR
jgi:transcriptional regulator with XRE-family HTH domain